MNLYHYIHSTLINAISEKFPEIDLSGIRIQYQVSPVNRLYISTAVSRVIMSTSGNTHDSNFVAHELVSWIEPDPAFINPDIFISDGFINFQMSPSYIHRILFTQPIFDRILLCNSMDDIIFQKKIIRLLDYADSFLPEKNVHHFSQYPTLNQLETSIITLIVFTEFTQQENSQRFIVNSLVTLLKKYYFEVPVLTNDAIVTDVRIRLIKQACAALYQQIKKAQPT